MGRTDGREEFESKLQTISLGVEKRFRATLKPHHIRELAAWQAQQPNGFGRKKSPKDLPGKSAFVFIDPKAQEVKVFDFVQITERSGGYKVRLGKGQRLEGNSVINIVFDSVPRRLLNEPLAYEFHRRVGNPVYLSSHLRLSVDGNLIGYHYLFGQPNKTFLKQNGLSDSGNLYKAYWMGRGLTGRHVKKSNPHSGHDDLIKLVKDLEETKSDADAQWELLQREFDVTQLVNHYAARMVLSDWDGFSTTTTFFTKLAAKRSGLCLSGTKTKRGVITMGWPRISFCITYHRPMAPIMMRARLTAKRSGGAQADTFHGQCWRTRIFESYIYHELGRYFKRSSLKQSFFR